MTKRDTWSYINNSDSCCNILFALKERWQDESRYENKQDYIYKFAEISGLKVVKMLEEPFAFIVECQDGYLKVTVAVDGRYYRLRGSDYIASIG